MQRGREIMRGKSLLAVLALAVTLASPAQSADRIILGYMTTLTGPGGFRARR